MSQPAGWYTNPDGTPSQRFWDGARWTHEVRPRPGAPSPAGSVGGPAGPAGPGALDPDPTAAASTAGPGSGEPSGGGGGLDRTVTVGGAPSTGPGAGPHQGPTPGPGPAPDPAGTQGGSIGELFALLFDFGLQRSFTAGTARLGYLLGSVAIVVVSILMLLGGLQGGGAAAVISIVLFPLLALLWLIALRGLMQLMRDRAVDGGTRESDRPTW